MRRASWFSLRCLNTQRLIHSGAKMVKSDTPPSKMMSRTKGGISQMRSKAKTRANEITSPRSPASMASVILIRHRCFLKLSSWRRRESGNGASLGCSGISDMYFGLDEQSFRRSHWEHTLVRYYVITIRYITSDAVIKS